MAEWQPPDPLIEDKEWTPPDPLINEGPDHDAAFQEAEFRLSQDPNDKKAKEALELQEVLGVKDPEPIAKSFESDASVMPKEDKGPKVDIRAPEGAQDDVSLSAPPEPTDMQFKTVDPLDQYIEKVRPDAHKAVKQSAEQLLEEYRRNPKMDLPEEWLDNITRAAMEDTTPATTLKDYGKGVAEGLTSPKKIGQAALSGAETGVSAVQEIQDMVSHPIRTAAQVLTGKFKGGSAPAGVVEGASMLPWLVTDASRGLHNVADFLDPLASEADKKKYQEDRIQRAIESAKEHHFVAKLNQKVGGALGAHDPSDPLYKASSFAGMAIAPAVGAEAALSKPIANLAEGAVNYSIKGAAMMKAPQLATRLIKPAWYVARQQYGKAAVSLLLGEGKSGGLLDKLRKQFLTTDKPSNWQDIMKVAAEIPADVPVVPHLQGEIDKELQRLTFKDQFIRNEAGAKISRADAIDPATGELGFKTEDLTGADKEVRIIKEQKDQLTKNRAVLDTIGKYHRLATDFAKATGRVMGNTAVTGATLGGISALEAQPSQVQEATAEGTEAGVALGFPCAFHYSSLGKKGMQIDRTVAAGKKILPKELVSGMSPEMQRYFYAHAAIAEPLGGSIKPLSPEEIIAKINEDNTAVGKPELPDGSVAPAGWFDENTNTLYVNKNAPFSAGHELGHLAEKQMAHSFASLKKDIMGRIEGSDIEQSAPYQKFAEAYLDRAKKTNPNYAALSPERIGEEVRAEISRQLLNNLGPQEFYGGKSGGKILSDWLSKKFGKKGDTSFKTTNITGAPYKESDLNNLADIYYQLGAKAQAGQKIIGPPKDIGAAPAPEVLPKDIRTSLKKKGFTDEQIDKLHPEDIGPKFMPSGSTPALRLADGEIVKAKDQEVTHPQILARLLEEDHPNVISKSDDTVDAGWVNDNGEFKTSEELTQGLGHRPDTIYGDQPKFMPSSHPDAIKGAAIRDNETGEVFSGDRDTLHGELLRDQIVEKRKGVPPPLGYDSGFVTNSGEYLNRDKSYDRAKEHSQLNKTDTRESARLGLDALDISSYMPAPLREPASMIDGMIFKGSKETALEKARDFFGRKPKKVTEGWLKKDGSFMDAKLARLEAEESGQVPESLKDKLTPEDFDATRRYMPSSDPDAIKNPAWKLEDGRIISDNVGNHSFIEFPKGYSGNAEPGFVTNSGDFLDRRQGYDRAKSKQQINGKYDKLFKQRYGGESFYLGKDVVPAKGLLEGEAFKDSRRYMPAQPDNPEAIDRPAIMRKSDGKVFKASTAATPHWMMPNQYPELRDRFTLGGDDRYVDGWTNNKGDFLDKDKGYEAAIKQKQIAKDFQTEYKGSLSTMDFKQGRKYMPSSHPDAIKEAAIRLNGEDIFTGATHSHAIGKAIHEGGYNVTKFSNRPKEEGFVTNSGEFLDRQAAETRAASVGQLQHDSQEGLEAIDFNRTKRFMPAYGEPTVNIGLHTNEGGKITQEEALAALRKHGVAVTKTSIHDSGTEPTLVASLSRPLTSQEGHQLSLDLKQDIIPQHAVGKGEMFGKGNPEHPEWNTFSPDYFLNHEGKPISEKPKTKLEALSDFKDVSQKGPFGPQAPYKPNAEEIAASRATPPNESGKWDAMKPEERMKILEDRDPNNPDNWDLANKRWFQQPENKVTRENSRYMPATPEFKKWFGHSKTVDEKGKPIVFYHGSKQDVSIFKPSTPYSNGVLYVSTNPTMASDWVTSGKGGARTRTEGRLTSDEVLRNEQDDIKRHDASVDWDRIEKESKAGEFGYFDASMKPKRDLSRIDNARYSSVYPVYVKAEKIFDPRTDYREVEPLLKTMPEMNGIIEKGIHKQGNWVVYEDGKVVQLLKNKGYDAAWISEDAATDLSKPSPHETLAVFNPQSQIKSATGNTGAFDPSSSDIRYMPAGDEQWKWSKIAGLDTDTGHRATYKLQLMSTKLSKETGRTWTPAETRSLISDITKSKAQGNDTPPELTQLLENLNASPKKDLSQIEGPIIDLSATPDEQRFQQLFHKEDKGLSPAEEQELNKLTFDIFKKYGSVENFEKKFPAKEQKIGGLYMPSAHPDAISEAAIKWKDGSITTGRDHLAAYLAKYPDSEAGHAPVVQGYKEGFIDNSKKFYERDEAHDQAVKMGQVTDQDLKKYSDIYHPPHLGNFGIDTGKELEAATFAAARKDKIGGLYMPSAHPDAISDTAIRTPDGKIHTGREISRRVHGMDSGYFQRHTPEEDAAMRNRATLRNSLYQEAEKLPEFQKLEKDKTKAVADIETARNALRDEIADKIKDVKFPEGMNHKDVLDTLVNQQLQDGALSKQFKRVNDIDRARAKMISDYTDARLPKMPEATGEPATGAIHTEIQDALEGEYDDADLMRSTDGYVTKTGRFLDKKRALDHATDIKQLDEDAYKKQRAEEINRKPEDIKRLDSMVFEDQRKYMPAPEEYKDVSDKLGLRYEGPSLGGRAIAFTDQKTGSTLDFPKDITPEALASQIKDHREKFIKGGTKAQDEMKMMPASPPDTEEFKKWSGGAPVVLDAGRAPLNEGGAVSGEDAMRMAGIPKNQWNDYWAHLTNDDRSKMIDDTRDKLAEVKTPDFKTGSPVVVGAYHGTPSNKFTVFDPNKMGSYTGAPSAREGFFFSGKPDTAESYTGKVDIELAQQTADHYRDLIRISKSQLEGGARYNDWNVWTPEQLKKQIETDTRNADHFDKMVEEAKNFDPKDKLHEVYVKFENPYVHDFKGKHYREESYFDLLQKAKVDGHDGAILTNTFDGADQPDNIFVAFKNTNIKSTSNTGTFDPSNPDIRYMPAVAHTEASIRNLEKAYRTANPDAVRFRYLKNDDGTYKRGSDGKPVPETYGYDFMNQPLAKEAMKGIKGEEARRQAVVDAGADHLEKIYDAMKDIPEVAQARGWYRVVREKLKGIFKNDEDVWLFSQLLGATSTRQNPRGNLLDSIDAFRGIKSGRFDDMMSRYKQAVDSGEFSNDYHYLKKNKLLPMKENGAQYAMNSAQVLKVMTDRWANEAQLKTGDYARNFSGSTIKSVIDQWAGRTLRRALGGQRLAPESEGGISNPAEYKLAQDAFHKLAERVGETPDDLQAILWFAEKYHWGERKYGSTSSAEKGDIRPLLEHLSMDESGQLKLGELPDELLTGKDLKARIKERKKGLAKLAQ